MSIDTSLQVLQPCAFAHYKKIYENSSKLFCFMAISNIYVIYLYPLNIW